MSVQMHWLAQPPDGHRMCVYECENALVCTAARRARDVWACPRVHAPEFAQPPDKKGTAPV